MCMIDDCDERYEMYEVKTRRARKDYKCYECHRPILVGEEYQCATGFSPSNSVWDTIHTCYHCADAVAWLRETCGGYVHAAAWEDLKDHWDESSLLRSMFLGRAIVGMRHAWKRSDGSLRERLGPTPGARMQSALRSMALAS